MASRRGYVTTTEVDELIGSGASTDLQISEAEEIIDAYVGFQQKGMNEVIEGRAAAVGGSTLTLQSDQQNQYDIDYLKMCAIEILGGTGAGQRRIITGQTKEGVVTVDSAWSTALSTDSFYRIWQLGKFPRDCDVVFYSAVAPSTYYKQIVEQVKRAVAAQVEFMVEMGDNYFQTNASEKQSESIGDYSYSLSDGAAGLGKLIAPKAKLLLRGIRNITGQITT